MKTYKQSFTLLLTILLTLLLTIACRDEPAVTPTTTSDTVGIPTRPVDGQAVTPETTITGQNDGSAPVAQVTNETSETSEATAASTIVPTPLSTPLPACTVQTEWPAYIVQNGDTLGEIATAVGSTVAELSEVNCITNPNLLEVGQTIYVPNIPPTPQIEPTPAIVVWKDYADATFKVNLAYPDKWVVKNEAGSTRIEGDDGFIFISAMGGGSLDTLAQNEANHSLLPYGTDPIIETITLPDGQPGRLILPSEDQPAGFNNVATIIATYPQPIKLNGQEYTHVMVQADAPNIRLVLGAMSLPGTTSAVNINSFTAEIVEVLDNGGRTVRFTWEGEGATYGRLMSGTAQRFMQWWEVEPSGTRTVQLNGTIFPDPMMTLQLFNEVTGAEETAQVQLEWACQHSYFFSPAPERCPLNPTQTVNGVYQPFENGFMIWRPDDTNSYIHVFYDDGTASLFADTWTAGQPESDPSLTPPSGLVQPVRGFGQVWRENTAVRNGLGWATAGEQAYTLNYQNEWRESLPGVSYVTRQNGDLIKITDTRWETFQSAQADRVDVPEVEAVVAAVLQNDTAAKIGVTQLTTFGCTTVLGIGGPPKCETGETAGTLVEFLPVMGPGHADMFRPDELAQILDFTVSSLYAIVQVPAGQGSEAYWPAGEYQLIFETASGFEPLTVLVSEGKIVRLVFETDSATAVLTRTDGQLLWSAQS